MTTAADTTTVYQGQYRVRNSPRWSTYCERPSASSAWDELLTAKGLPRGCDLRVVAVRPADLEDARR